MFISKDELAALKHDSAQSNRLLSQLNTNDRQMMLLIRDLISKMETLNLNQAKLEQRLNTYQGKWNT